MVAWDAIIGSGVAFAILVYALSLRERTEVTLNCAVYAFSTLVAGMAAAVLLTAVELGMALPDGGLILGRVIFASFATAVASATAMSYAYPFPVAKPGRFSTMIHGSGILLALLTLLTPLVIVGSRVGSPPGEPAGTDVPDVVILEFGVLAFPFALYAAVAHLAILRNEWRAWRRPTSPIHRKRARALFIGFLVPGMIAVFLTVALTLYLIAIASGVPPAPLELPFTSLIFLFPLFGVGYSLARYRLFDSELFLRENVVTIFAFFLGGYCVMVAMAVLLFAVPGMATAALLVLGLVMFAVMGASYQFLRAAAARVIDVLAPKQKWLEFQPVEAYLVKKASGVLIAHAARGEAKGPDQDIVGSMLSAVQEFVQSSFGSAEPLREMHLGKRRMLIEYGDQMYLAMVYDGRVSEAVRQDIAMGLVQMEKEHGEMLKKWAGKESDVKPLAEALAKILEGAYAKAQLMPKKFHASAGDALMRL